VLQGKINEIESERSTPILGALRPNTWSGPDGPEIDSVGGIIDSTRLQVTSDALARLGPGTYTISYTPGDKNMSTGFTVSDSNDKIVLQVDNTGMVSSGSALTLSSISGSTAANSSGAHIVNSSSANGAAPTTSSAVLVSTGAVTLTGELNQSSSFVGPIAPSSGATYGGPGMSEGGVTVLTPVSVTADKSVAHIPDVLGVGKIVNAWNNVRDDLSNGSAWLELVGGGLSMTSGTYTADQAALVDLAKLAKKLGVSLEQVEILRNWAKELGIPFRGIETHPNRPVVNFPHIHVGPVDHIPVKSSGPSLKSPIP
jgi:hypothetical protein